MANTISKEDWDILVDRVASQECTPFLGAGASAEVLPPGARLARELAEQYQYPFDDKDDLVRVSQFIAVNYDSTYPKEQVLKRFSRIEPPDFSDPDEPHAFFARLPLPVYMTTNYDDFLTRALKRSHREPRQEICRWNPSLMSRPSSFDAPSSYVPTPANPLVYHLHGHGKSESLVLTEDDYLEFLENLIKQPKMFPPPVEERLSNTMLLFIGYRVADWNLRVLLRLLRPSPRTRSLVVLGSDAKGPARKHAQKYLESYYERMQIRVFWGTAREFCAGFRRRLKAAGVAI